MYKRQPSISAELGAPVSWAGIISMIISLGTVVSSLQSDRLTRRLGAGRVTAFSVLLTALALLGFSFSRSFAALCLLAIPYGLGAGSVDAALNNYVALHLDVYKRQGMIPAALTRSELPPHAPVPLDAAQSSSLSPLPHVSLSASPVC